MFLFCLDISISNSYSHMIYIYWFASLFEKYDSDKNKVLTQSELKDLIQTVKFGEWRPDHDEIVETVMKDFDEDGDKEITEQEFVSGITKWLNKATHVAKCSDPKRSVDEYDKVSLIIFK